MIFLDADNLLMYYTSDFISMNIIIGYGSDFSFVDVLVCCLYIDVCSSIFFILWPLLSKVVSFDGSTTVQEFLTSLNRAINARDCSQSGFALFADHPTHANINQCLRPHAKVFRVFVLLFICSYKKLYLNY